MTPAESDVEDSTGSLSTTGTHLGDFEDTKINLLGKEYTIVIARRPGSIRENSARLVLMGGGVKDVLIQGEKKTYTVGGKKYDVELIFVDSTFAKFVVNGETTNKLRESETYMLANGVEIGPSQIIYQGLVGGVAKAEFFLGAQKLELRDDDVEDDSLGSYPVKAGIEDVDGTTVTIKGSDDNVTFKINSIEVGMMAEDDYYVAPGKKLSDTIAEVAEEKEVLFTNNWDIEFRGLTIAESHKIGVEYDDVQKSYKLNFYDGNGNKVSVPVAFAVKQYDLALGSGTNAFVVKENMPIKKNDYFLLTGGSAAAGTAKSFVLQYKGADNINKPNPKIKFKDMGSGNTFEYGVALTDQQVIIMLGGYSFRVDSVGGPSAVDDWTINVDLDGDGVALEQDAVSAVDSYGAEMEIKDNSNQLEKGFEDSISIMITTPDAEDYDTVAPAPVAVKMFASSGPQVEALYEGVILLTPEGQSDTAFGYTSMGGKLSANTVNGALTQFVYGYPKKQRLPQVYVIGGTS